MTLALAFVMAMNYVAILLCPFIVDAVQSLFHSDSQTFAFWLNLMVGADGHVCGDEARKVEFIRKIPT